MKYCRSVSRPPKKEPVFWVLKYLQHLDQSLILNYDWSNHQTSEDKSESSCWRFCQFFGKFGPKFGITKKNMGKSPMKYEKFSMTFRFFPYLNHVFFSKKMTSSVFGIALQAVKAEPKAFLSGLEKRFGTGNLGGTPKSDFYPL